MKVNIHDAHTGNKKYKQLSIICIKKNLLELGTREFGLGARVCVGVLVLGAGSNPLWFGEFRVLLLWRKRYWNKTHARRRRRDESRSFGTDANYEREWASLGEVHCMRMGNGYT